MPLENNNSHTILVVDDSASNLGVISDYLQSVGFAALIATDGRLAVERAQYAQPDLILMDVLMPGIDGFEACQLLKENEHTKDIPVIFMTALTETEHKVEGFRVGAVDFVTKPFQKEEILARIRTHIHLRELTERLEHKVSERTQELMEANLQLQQEIVERRRAEDALRDSEERFRRLAENAKDMIYRMSLPDGRYEYVSPAAQELYGYTPDEFYANPKLIAKVIHPDWMDHFERGWANLVDGVMPPSYEYKINHKNGEVRWLYQRNVLVRDQAGVPIALEGIVTDITERKQAEQEREQLLTQIQEQVQQVQNIIDTVPEGVLLMDADGRVVLANPLARKDISVLAGAQVGDTISRLGDLELDELLSPHKGWHQTRAKGQFYDLIARSMGTPIQTSSGWVVVIRQMTLQREIQQRVQQQERLAAVGQLAAGIAHDFNNIMAVIILYAQMLNRMSNLTPKFQDRLETIIQQARHATDLIGQILDFSRSSVLERRPLDLVPLLREQIKLLDRTLPESIEIQLLHANDDYTVNADPTRIQQIVMNLALNARDAMPDGGELHIELDRVTIQPHDVVIPPGLTAGQWVRMLVRDTGKGIPADVLPRVFDPFFTTKEPGEGTGLGLAQVHGIVKQHDGEIDVESQEGQGATFYVYLPALEVPGKSDELRNGSLPTYGRGEKILVVEDSAQVRKALKDSLELLNYTALAVKNGRDALSLLKEGDQEIALVLSDLVMPGMGGRALAQAIHDLSTDSDRPPIPVVVVSGHLLENEIEALRAAGVAGWVKKPPSLEQLAQAIAQALYR